VRVIERSNFAIQLIENGFNFDIDEQYQFDRREAPRSVSTVDLNEVWHKRVKNDYLNLKLSEKEAKEIEKNSDKKISKD